MMSSLKASKRLLLLRWNLQPSIAALWQLAAQRAFQDLDISASWIEIDPQWNPSLPIETEKMSAFAELPDHGRPSALIIGIERSHLSRIARQAVKLRELCNRLPFDTDAERNTTSSRTFLIAWFPQADRESIPLLQELGFSLVLHNPSQVQAILSKIAQSVGRESPPSF